jgi:hypothetical protein
MVQVRTLTLSQTMSLSVTISWSLTCSAGREAPVPVPFTIPVYAPSYIVLTLRLLVAPVECNRWPNGKIISLSVGAMVLLSAIYLAIW